MKLLHRAGLFGWSRFDESRNLDFNSVLWVRDGGNVVIDPLPLSAHEQKRLESLGGVAHVVVTNSDHVRATRALREATGAKVYGPHAERDSFPVACDAWLAEGGHVVDGLEVLVLDGSKTSGELALLIEGTTLVTGDLVRGHRAGTLNLLPNDKLQSRERALASVAKLAARDTIEAVLVGDGWPVFRDGKTALAELLAAATQSA